MARRVGLERSRAWKMGSDSKYYGFKVLKKEKERGDCKVD
jgi:hypothetical protein